MLTTFPPDRFLSAHPTSRPRFTASASHLPSTPLLFQGRNPQPTISHVEWEERLEALRSAINNDQPFYNGVVWLSKGGQPVQAQMNPLPTFDGPVLEGFVLCLKTDGKNGQTEKPLGTLYLNKRVPNPVGQGFMTEITQITTRYSSGIAPDAIRQALTDYAVLRTLQLGNRVLVTNTGKRIEAQALWEQLDQAIDTQQ